MLHKIDHFCVTFCVTNWKSLLAMALMRNLDQYLQLRANRWHYVRRVPKEYSDIDKRGVIRKSLGTESLELARMKRDELAKADEVYWRDLSAKMTMHGTEDPNSLDVFKKYERARAIAMAHGFSYKKIDLLREAPLQEILLRVEALEKGHGEIAPKEVADALLGTIAQPKVTITQAFEIYCNEIAASKLFDKSETQKRNWKKPKNRAVKNFVALNGNLAMEEITREHARKIYSWWADRINPQKTNDPKSPDSGNKDLGNLHILYREYWKYEGDESRENPFRNLRFERKAYKNADSGENDQAFRDRVTHGNVS